MKLAAIGAAASLFAIGLPAAPAMAAMGACESAYVKPDLEDQIRLYTICLEGLFEEQLPGAYHNRGVAHLLNGQPDRALADFELSLLYDSGYGLAYFNRAIVYAQRGMVERAIEDLSTTLKLRPSRLHRDAYLRRASLEEARGRYAEAISDYEAVAAMPLLWLGAGRKLQKRQRAAALIGHSRILATAPEDAVRDGARAVELAQAALEIEDTPYARAALAAAFAETGQMERAMQEQTRATGANVDAQAGWEELLAAQGAALQAGQPYREQVCGSGSGAECARVAWAAERMSLSIGRVSSGGPFSSGTAATSPY